MLESHGISVRLVTSAVLAAVLASTSASSAPMRESVRTYALPISGIMGIDFDPALAEELARDIAESKPKLIVIEIDARSGAIGQDEPKIDIRRETSVIPEMRDAVDSIRRAAGSATVAVLVRDAVGVEAVAALAWPKVYMAPAARIGLPIDASPSAPAPAKQEDDIRAKMRSAWIGMAEGIIDGSHSRAQLDAIVAAGSEGLDATRAMAAGVCDAEAADQRAVAAACGYPETVLVGNGPGIAGRASAEWRKQYRAAARLIAEYEEPVDSKEDLANRRKLLAEVRSAMAASPRLARALEWSRGLTDQRAGELLAMIDAQTAVLPAWAEMSGSGGKRFVRLRAAGPIGDVVTAGAIDAAGSLADASGRGQIVVIELESPGGLVTEVFAMLESIKRLRERHRVVAWIREATNGAAAVALACDDLVFRPTGLIGAAMFIGKPGEDPGKDGMADQRRMFEREIAEAVESARGRGRFMTAMTEAKPIITYTVDPSTKRVTFHDSVTGMPGEVTLTDAKDSLVLNSSNAKDCGLSAGTADTDEELARILQSLPAKAP
jgi:hypothetical protein